MKKALLNQIHSQSPKLGVLATLSAYGFLFWGKFFNRHTIQQKWKHCIDWLTQNVLQLFNKTGFLIKLLTNAYKLSRDMRFPTMWYVLPAKAQTSLRKCAVWSEPLQVALIFYEWSATGWTAFRFSKLKSRLYRLAWVYTCRNATLLEITCHGSDMCF